MPKSSTSLTANVQAFQADLDCQIALVQNISTSKDNGTVTINVTLTSPYCPMMEYQTSTNSDQFETYIEQPSTQCNDGVGHVLMASGFVNETSTETPDPLSHVNLSNIICRPSYSIYPATVMLGTNASITSSPSVTVDTGAEPSTFPAVAAEDIITAMLVSYKPFPEWFAGGTSGDMSLADYFAAVLPNTPTEVLVASPELYLTAARTFFKSFAVQIADVYLTTETNQTVPGSITSSEGRLVIRPLAFGLIEGFMAVMAILSALLTFVGPRKTTPTDPGPIGNFAAILAASPGLSKTLQGTGAHGLSVVRERLSDTGYRTATSQDGSHEKFSIVQTDGESDESADRGQYASVPSYEGEEEKKKISWYRPFAVTLPAKILVIGVPIAVIVVLETLYQVSRRKDGITDIASDEYAHYAYTYVPTTVLVAIGLLFASLDFSTKTFQPYATLSRGPASSQPSLYEDYLGKLGLHCLWRAVKHRQVAVASSSLGMVLTPLLTIAVSGLFFVAGVNQSYDVQLSQQTYFPPSAYNQSGSAAIDDGYNMVGLVLADNSSEPLFTYDTLAFPQLDFSSMSAESFSNGLEEGKISARVTASRAQLNCTVVPRERIHTQNNIMKRQLLTGPPSTSDPSSDPSSDTSPSSNSTYGPESGFAITVDSTGDGNCSRLTSGILQNNDTYYGSFEFDYDNPDLACPRNRAIFAQFEDTNLTDITVLACNPYLERVETDVTFNAADFSLDLSTPPSPDETTARTVGTIILDNLSNNLDIPTSIHPTTDQDSFFSLLLHGSSAIPPNELIGTANQARLLAAANALYGRILAQVLNARRAPAPAGTPRLAAALRAPHRLRLLQNAVPTRILEGLLAGLVVCAAVTCATLDTKHVLPKNPCSIAAVASLLAGSRMLGRDVVPEGAEWLGSGEKRAKGVYEGRVFRMGWWAGGRFGIDVDEAAEKGGEGGRPPRADS